VKGRSGEAAGAGEETQAVAGSGDAEVALQVRGRSDGENTGELGMATVQDIARRRGAASVLGRARGLSRLLRWLPVCGFALWMGLQKWPFERAIYTGDWRRQDALI
jgi:hypothetical protein